MKIPKRICTLGVLFVLIHTALAATHTLTLNTNGNGSVARNPTNAVYPNGAVVTITGLPASGWVFNSWSGDATGSLNPTNITMDADKIITANFIQLPSYSLTVNVTGNGSVAPTGGSFLSNTLVQLAATPSNGWEFHHWSGDVAGSANPQDVLMNGNKSITATFVQPLLITSQPTGGTVNVGDSFGFSVGASGSPTIGYQWLLNGSAIGGATSATLALTNVQTSQAGSYRAVVTNPYASATSDVATLVVNCPGTNTVTVCSDADLRQAVAIGGTIRFCCNGVITLTNTLNVTKDTTLDASGQNIILSGGTLLRLFNVSSGVTLTMTNLTLADGRYVGATGGATGESAVGAAIKNNGGTVRLYSCVVSNHAVTAGSGTSVPGAALGGAIYNAGGTVELNQTLLVGNKTTGASAGAPPTLPYNNGGALSLGGALFSTNGTVIVNGSTFVGNSTYHPLTKAAGSGGGGGIWAADSLSITDSLFLANSASSQNAAPSASPPNTAALNGGAVLFQSGSGTVLRVRFATNTLVGAASRTGYSGEAHGGALWNLGNLIVRDCSFVANAATGGSGQSPGNALGGAIHNSGTLVIDRTTVQNSTVVSGGTRAGFNATTEGYGGGVFNAGTLSITNSTITANSVQGGEVNGGLFPGSWAYGGGLFNNGGTVIAVNTTFATNMALRPFPTFDLSFGRNIGNTNGTISLQNSLISGEAESVWGAVTDGGYNMSSDGTANFSSGSSFNFTDPKLLPLADNSGPTLTMALAANSPAIDWAPAAGAPATDQRGMARPSSGANVVDLGAYEFVPAPPPLVAARSGSSLNISFVGSSGKTYRLERCDNFSNWELHELIGPLPGDGPVTRTIPAALSCQFFRLRWGP